MRDLKDRSYFMIDKSEEHDFQFSTRRAAETAARMETLQTHRKHQAFLCTTYRDLTPRICWAVVLKLHWQGDNLVTE